MVKLVMKVLICVPKTKKSTGSWCDLCVGGEEEVGPAEADQGHGLKLMRGIKGDNFQGE